MPRKKKTDTEPKTNGAGPGHNGPPELTDEQKQALALQWKKQFQSSLTAKNKAASEHSNLCKRMKTEMGKDAVDLVKTMIAMETEEGEAEVKAKIEMQMRAARYMAAPMGAQFDIFEDRTPAVDRAREEGKRDGMAGETAVPSYDSGTPQYDAYMEGWHSGQAAIFDIQKLQDGEIFDQAEASAEAEAEAMPA